MFQYGAILLREPLSESELAAKARQTVHQPDKEQCEQQEGKDDEP